jgi:L-rhamnose isomerase
MYISEEMKMMPIGDVWEEFLRREGVIADYLPEIRKYESEVLSKR